MQFITEIISLPSFSLSFLVISVCINFILAILVLKNDYRSDTNRLYGILSIFLSIWLVVIFGSSRSDLSPQNALFLARLSLFIAAPMTLTFFIFAHTIPSDRIQLKKKWLATSVLVTLFIMAACFTPFLMILGEQNGIEPSWGMAGFGTLTIFYSLSAVFLLTKKLLTSQGILRKQYQYIMLGLLLMTGFITSTIFFPVLLENNQTYLPLAPLYALFFLGATAYSIIHHQLFDLKIIATKFFVAILSIIFFARLFATSDVDTFLFELSIFLSTVFFGYLLIKSVNKEVEQREQLAKLNRRLKRSNIRLEELLKLKSEFVGIASHQLRTPLTVLRGLLDMQVNGDFNNLPEAKVKSLQMDMLKSAVRLNSLISDLMDMTKMEGGITLQIKEVNLCDLLSEITQQLSSNFKQKNLETSMVCVNEIPPIEGDPKYLHEAFSNLIDNAEKYTQKGGISIRVRRVGPEVVVKIVDTGIGLTAEDKAKLFKKFTRGERSTTIHTEGTGLGLYIVKRVIDAHNGQISFDSEGAGKGTTVTVTLPIKYEN